MYTFERLYIWQLSNKLFIILHDKFGKSTFREYYFKDQLLRACLSISNNIAEWHERMSKKQESAFLWYARWSTWEVRSMLLIAEKVWYISSDELEKYSIMLKKISSWLFTMIQKNN